MQVLTTMPSGHHESHSSGYTQDSWMNINAYSQPSQHTISPMNEYQGFDYGHTTSLPMEPAYSIPRPPPYAAPAHHPLPPPLVMPQNGVWPSMLTNSNQYQHPILPAGPIQTPISAATSHGSDITPTSAKSTSRRKLTDEERRQMCLEAENNPTMKQTQIGAKFNVERSTVSKILRQKDKYMKPQAKEETVTSPNSKKSKVKLPDFEKTLANWVRNQQKKGVPITDEELRKQAGLFSAGRSDQQTLSSSSWLDRFKQKYLENHHSDSRNETPVDTSPISSNGLVSPPMSTVDENAPGLPRLDQHDHPFDFGASDVFDDSDGLHHDVPTDATPSQDTILSPVSPNLLRGNAASMAIADEDHFGNPMVNARQRSQTFHHLPNATLLSHPSMSARNTPMPVRSMTTASTTNQREISIDPRQMMKRHKSVPDIHDAEIVRFSTMQPPPLPRSADVSPISHPGSPSSDDHMRALHMIKKMLEQRPDIADADDYVMIGKLMEKLKLLRSPTNTPILPAGLHSMEVSESPRLSRKRTILGISN